MIAVDTNVVVRLLVADDERQFGVARELFAGGPVWIGETVLVETAWVLGRLYGMDAETILGALERLTSLANVKVGSGVEEALRLAKAGVDLADAMHLSSRPAGAEFATFDRAFARRARRAGAKGLRELAG